MKLTFTERWILSNQFEILALLDKKSKAHYENMGEIVQRGYELDYDSITQHIDKTTLNESESLFVLDVLDMYRQIQFGYKQLTGATSITDDDVFFLGFDGNHETELMAYARFRLKEGDWGIPHKSKDLNSHSPMRSGYKKMIDEWKKSRDPAELSEGDIKRILAAR